MHQMQVMIDKKFETTLKIILSKNTTLELGVIIGNQTKNHQKWWFEFSGRGDSSSIHNK